VTDEAAEHKNSKAFKSPRVGGRARECEPERKSEGDGEGGGEKGENETKDMGIDCDQVAMAPGALRVGLTSDHADSNTRQKGENTMAFSARQWSLNTGSPVSTPGKVVQ
jgi:hypothetical protein